LYNCILIECTIHGSKIELSRLEDCRVRKKTPGTSDTTSETTFISCCRSENSTFYDAAIFNSTINGALSVQISEMENSLVVDSLIIGSKLKECGISSSDLHDCSDIKCFLTDPVVEVRNILTLRNLPVEVREMIYTYFMGDNEHDNNLVTALRPNPLFYTEVLGTCFKEHVFHLSASNHKIVISAPPEKALRIRKLHIKFVSPFLLHMEIQLTKKRHNPPSHRRPFHLFPTEHQTKLHLHRILPNKCKHLSLLRHHQTLAQILQDRDETHSFLDGKEYGRISHSATAKIAERRY
jgi:hypothetical protein